MTKEAQQQVRSEAFSDELFKIAAENVLGPDVDWDNLTPEQLKKDTAEKAELATKFKNSYRNITRRLSS